MVSQQDLDTMGRRGEMHGSENREHPREPSTLDILGELSSRLSALENKFDTIQQEWNSARDNSAAGLNVAHVNHIMMKHFPHDLPDVNERSESERSSG